MLSADELNEIYENLVGDSSAKSQAVASIYEKLSPFLYKKMRYRFRALSEEDVHDILQDAFLKIYLTGSKPKSPAMIPGWVFAIAENAALDLFRKAYKKNELDWPHPLDGERAEFGASEVPLESMSENRNRDVEDCVSQGMGIFSSHFPERELAISMSLDGSSMAEIATVFGRSEGAMKQYIYESKKKLAPFIKHCIGELS